MSRYLIQFSYDGGSFHGFQSQPNAHTVQSELDEKLSLLIGTPIETTGSSRTDTGVHAQQQFAHFDLPESCSLPSDASYRINRMLPTTLVVQAFYQVSEDFNARFEAVSRTYEYRIARQKNPFSRDYAYWFEAPLAISQMNEACGILISHDDFQSFSKVKTEVNTFICDIQRAEWVEEGDALVFTIQANRFLRGMVRAIVGTLLEIGLGKWNVEDLQRILESKDRKLAGRAVPAHGLHLIEVEYPPATFAAKCS
jgi:tRNA pseudouridine38-40 synthase